MWRLIDSVYSYDVHLSLCKYACVKDKMDLDDNLIKLYIGRFGLTSR